MHAAVCVIIIRDDDTPHIEMFTVDKFPRGKFMWGHKIFPM